MNKITPEANQVEERKAHQQHDYGYDKSLNLKPGQKLWRFNMLTQELTVEPLHRKKDFDLATGDPTPVYKVNKDPNSLYFPAINKKNAVRKLLLQFGYKWDRKNKKPIALFETVHEEKIIYMNANPADPKVQAPQDPIANETANESNQDPEDFRLHDGVDEGAPDDDFTD